MHSKSKIRFNSDSFPVSKIPDILNATDDPVIQYLLKKLSTMGDRVSVCADTILADEGEVPLFCYVLIEGEAASVRTMNSGNQHVFWDSLFTDKDPTICIPSIITNRPLTVSIVARTDASLLRIPKQDLLDAISEDSEFAFGISRLMALKFTRTSNTMHELAEVGSRQRFYNLLDKLATEYGVEEDGVTYIRTAISQQSLANYLGVDRTTIFRAFRNLKNEGVLDYIDNYYCIKDMARFREHCHSPEA